MTLSFWCSSKILWFVKLFPVISRVVRIAHVQTHPCHMPCDIFTGWWFGVWSIWISMFYDFPFSWEEYSHLTNSIIFQRDRLNHQPVIFIQNQPVSRERTSMIGMPQTGSFDKEHVSKVTGLTWFTVVVPAFLDKHFCTCGKSLESTSGKSFVNSGLWSIVNQAG